MGAEMKPADRGTRAGKDDCFNIMAGEHRRFRRRPAEYRMRTEKLTMNTTWR